jgi:hypothetical protein
MSDISFTDHLAKKIDEGFGEFLNRRQIRELVDLFIEEGEPIFVYQTYTKLKQQFTELEKKYEDKDSKAVFTIMISAFDQSLKTMGPEKVDTNDARSIS